MKYYQVIDLQGTDFMADTYKKPATLNELRARFWALDEARTTHYKYFTSDYIQEVWYLQLEEA